MYRKHKTYVTGQLSVRYVLRFKKKKTDMEAELVSKIGNEIHIVGPR